MSTPLQSISKIRREITDQLDALENLATSKAKALETAEQRYLELERERDGLNRDQTELASRVDELKAQLANRDTVPRVIPTDELEEGQWIAVAFRGNPAKWVTGRVFRDHQINGFGIGRGAQRRDILPTATLVLLEDTPAEEPETVKVGDTISTLEQLEELPKEAILRGRYGDALEQGSEGWWTTGATCQISSSLALSHAPLTVLYLPEEDA
ncbi:hypothetical protein ACFP47_10265 [Nesterenkonia lacusekhoensis]|uniref:Uncharacterized protein n=1 Tax=Nesterenkonia lacusekhoensis TaxID=150832 RepID=A0ABS4T536_9MICC|nr:hypothetical protein [Nesterenkonia lacusekhoensis]MBP2319585.1 hypothetical protein [Nesterenkonia lacusekhoensis]